MCFRSENFFATYKQYNIWIARAAKFVTMATIAIHDSSSSSKINLKPSFVYSFQWMLMKLQIGMLLYRNCTWWSLRLSVLDCCYENQCSTKYFMGEHLVVKWSEFWRIWYINTVKMNPKFKLFVGDAEINSILNNKVNFVHLFTAVF